MFKDVQFMTAKQKQQVFNAWKRFIKGGFKFEQFSDALYKHLSLHCSFIAHYNRGGFWETYFQNPQDTAKFFTQFDRTKGCESVEYGMNWIRGDYEDLNNALVDFVQPLLAIIYTQCGNEERDHDISAAKRLLEKHGYSEVAGMIA